MVLKKRKYNQVEGRKPVLILSFISSCVSFVGMFFGLLPIRMNTMDKKAEYIAGLVSENVDIKQAEALFNLYNGILRYVLIISIIILVLGTINLFLMSWILHKDNKKKVGIFIYIFSIAHIFSFRLIESILIYRQAMKFIMPDNQKVNKNK